VVTTSDYHSASGDLTTPLSNQKILFSGSFAPQAISSSSSASMIVEKDPCISPSTVFLDRRLRLDVSSDGVIGRCVSVFAYGECLALGVIGFGSLG
jgi:hypothetical protein